MKELTRDRLLELLRIQVKIGSMVQVAHKDKPILTLYIATYNENMTTIKKMFRFKFDMKDIDSYNKTVRMILYDILPIVRKENFLKFHNFVESTEKLGEVTVKHNSIGD